MNVSVRDLIYCKVCNELFDKPVMLPCGETICSKHEIDFKDARFQCTFCSGQHKLASETDHFPCNKIAQGLLEKQLQELNLGDIHKSAVASLKSLKESVQNFESFGDNAEDYIYEYFAKLRNQVDLQREAMIQKVNDSSDKLLCEIAALETKCKINCNKPGSKLPKADQLAQLKSEVGEWEKCLGKLVIDERQWTNIKKQCYESKAKLENDLQTFKDEVISCDVKSDDIERRFSNFDQFFLHDLGFV
jgi:primosomal protein N''